MAAKRKNPLQNAAERAGAIMKNVDSYMMKRMPADFQEMHKIKKATKAKAKTTADMSPEYWKAQDHIIGFSAPSTPKA